MKLKIGFESETFDEGRKCDTYSGASEVSPHRKSVVQVLFPGRGASLSYYNDRFDLQPGDIVYVDGKLEGQPGRVTDVNYNFKIRLADYKHVTAVVDTNVHGQFFGIGSHFITFDPAALPADQAAAWHRAPPKETDEFLSGSDDASFPLADLSGMNVSGAIAERGHNYYLENRVKYICVDGARGYAIVEGSEAYEVEFEYRNGEIGRLVCSCFCCYPCKHEVAAMLQLREVLKGIEERYAAEYARTDYFAAVDKGTLFTFAVDGKDNRCFTL